MRRLKKQSRQVIGYSLLETVISMSIVLAVIFIGSSLKPDTRKHQLKTAVNQIYSNLSLARFRAIRQQVPVKVSFKENFCQLSEFDSQRSFWVIKSRRFLEGVQVTANNTPVFYPQGTVSNLASIKISNERGLYLITVAITGRLKITQSD
ncbi:MAG: GspH/FimT family protein [Acidobacteriota bacterium]|nr:GspH/FimT family protein [Acidobacteriota bacterium]